MRSGTDLSPQVLVVTSLRCWVTPLDVTLGPEVKELDINEFGQTNEGLAAHNHLCFCAFLHIVSRTGLLRTIDFEVSIGQVAGHATPTRVELSEVGLQAFQRQIVETAVMPHVFHVTLATAVKRVVDGVIYPVEIQRQKAELFAKTDI